MANEYWIRRDNRIMGPYSAEQLREMVSTSYILSNDYISKNQVRWVKADQVKGLLFHGGEIRKKQQSGQTYPKSYWIRYANQVSGPYTARELKRLADRAQITAECEISKDQEHWKKADSVKGLILRQSTGGIQEEKESKFSLNGDVPSQLAQTKNSQNKAQRAPTTSIGFKPVSFRAETRPFVGRGEKYTVQLSEKDMTITADTAEHENMPIVVARHRAKEILKVKGGSFRVLDDEKCTFYPVSKKLLVLKAISDWSEGKSPKLHKPTLKEILRETHPALRPALVAVWVQYHIFWVGFILMCFGVGLMGFTGNFWLWITLLLIGTAAVLLFGLAIQELRNNRVWICGVFAFLNLAGILLGTAPSIEDTTRILGLALKCFRLVFLGVNVIIHLYCGIRYVAQSNLNRGTNQ